jgi:hypothetical protein
MQHVQDVAAELRACIQQEHPMVRPRHLAGQRHLATTDQADIRDRVVRGATRVGRDQRRAVTGEAGDAMDAGGVEALARSIAGRRVFRGGPASSSPRPATPGGAHYGQNAWIRFSFASIERDPGSHGGCLLRDC